MAFLLSFCLAATVGVAAPAPTIKDQLRDGWNAFRLEEYPHAAYAFEQAAKSLPAGSLDLRQAEFGLATTLAHRAPDPDRPGARTLFLKVADGARDDLAAWSLLALARLLHVAPVGETIDMAAVRAAYQQVITSFPDHPAAEEALIFQQSTLVATLAPADAVAALARLTAFIARHPHAKFLSPAWSLIAECENSLKHPAARLAAEIRALDTLEVDPTNPWMDKAWNYWRIATIAEFEANEPSTAKKFYSLLAREYPTDQRSYGAQQAIRRLGGR